MVSSSHWLNNLSGFLSQRHFGVYFAVESTEFLKFLLCANVHRPKFLKCRPKTDMLFLSQGILISACKVNLFLKIANNCAFCL